MSERPRILLIHGFLSGPAAWDRLRAHLDAVADTEAPPLPGFGGMRAPEEMTPEALAAALQPAIERFCPTHLVGHSMGAIVTLAAIGSNPGAFEGAGLIGLPVFGSRSDGRAFLHSRGRVHRTLLRFDDVSHAGCRALFVTRRGWWPLLPWLAPGIPRAHAHGAFHHSASGHRRALDEAVFAGLVPRLAAGVSGTLSLLHGENDRVAPVARARDLAGERGWTFAAARGAGHQVMVTRPRLTARWVRERVIADRDDGRGLSTAGHQRPH